MDQNCIRCQGNSGTIVLENAKVKDFFIAKLQIFKKNFLIIVVVVVIITVVMVAAGAVVAVVIMIMVVVQKYQILRILIV